MGRKMQHSRLTRREKLMQERLEAKAEATASTEPRPRDSIPKLEPKTQNQRTALRLLTAGTQITFLAGSAGSGKSMIAAYHAAVKLRSKQIDKILLVRPAIGVGKSIGMLPGTIIEKLTPYFAQTLVHLEKFLGTGYLKYCIEKGVIEMQPAEYIRGRSFEGCIVICEESQGFTHAEFEMMLTRLGESCQMIFTGDEKQSDLKVETGLRTTTALIERMLQTHPSYMESEDIDSLDSQVGIVRFTPADVVRSGLTRAFVRMYFNN